VVEKALDGDERVIDLAGSSPGGEPLCRLGA